MVGLGIVDVLLLKIGFGFAQAARADDRPIQAAALKGPFAQSLHHQDQAKEVEGMAPAAGAEGAHQKHPVHADGFAGPDLVAHGPGIDPKGRREIDSRPGSRGDHQGLTAVEGLLQGWAIPQLQAHQLGTFQPRGRRGGWTQQRPHSMAPGQGLLNDPPARFAGGTADRQEHGVHR